MYISLHFLVFLPVLVQRVSRDTGATALEAFFLSLDPYVTSGTARKTDHCYKCLYSSPSNFIDYVQSLSKNPKVKLWPQQVVERAHLEVKFLERCSP